MTLKPKAWTDMIWATKIAEYVYGFKMSLPWYITFSVKI